MTATASHDVFLTLEHEHGMPGMLLVCSCGWRYRWQRSIIEPAEVAEVAAEHLELADRPPIDLEALSPLERAMAAIVTVAALKAMHRPNTARMVAALATQLEADRRDTWDDYETDTWWPAIDHAKQAEMAAERHRTAGGISDDAPVFEALPEPFEHHLLDPPDPDYDRYYCSCGFATDIMAEMLSHRDPLSAIDLRAGRNPLEVAEMDARTRAVSLGMVAPPAELLAEADQEAGYAVVVPFPGAFDAAEHARVPTCPHCRHTHQPGTFCGAPIARRPFMASDPTTCQCEGWAE